MIELWTIAIAVLTAVTCAISGTFLVVRRDALVAEGLAHAVLPGIVVAFVITGSRTSPLLILGAAATGLAMVALTEVVRRTGVVDRDASLGVVFPALFSLGVLLASAELGGVHFHAECIIEGNLSLAVFDRAQPFGVDIGPRPFWTLAIVLVLELAFIAAFFKELTLAAFDPELATTLRRRPGQLQAAWLALVAIVAVAAFEAVGSILVVALMIAPAAAASLWTVKIGRLIVIAALIGAASAALGFGGAYALDVAPAGPMATLAGLLFVVSLVASPRQGLFAGRRARRQGGPESLDARLLARRAGGGRDPEQVRAELDWAQGRFDRALREAVAAGLLEPRGGLLAPPVS